jgi:hypothetical protein
VLNDLPEGLSATYERALNKIGAGGTTKIAEKILRWVAAAKRYLTLEELREAIAVEPCQRSRNPETTINVTNQLVPCCRNLIQLDEELRTVYFAHHTVKGLLLAESKDQSWANFHFQLPQANLEVGEICVTYLNSEELRMQLVRHVRRTAVDILANPSGLLKASLEKGLNRVKFSTHLMHFSRGKKAKLGKDTERIIRHFMASGGPRDRQPSSLESYSLLSYAREHWLSHTQDLSVKNAEIWNLWTRLLSTEESQFAQTPWTLEQLLCCDQMVIQWIVDNCHFALLRYTRHIQDDDSGLMRRFWDHFTTGGHQKFLHLLLQLGDFQIADLNERLRNAAYETAPRTAVLRHDVTTVELLLHHGVDVNTFNWIGKSILYYAVAGQNINLAKILLSPGADVNIATEDGITALDRAYSRGNEWNMKLRSDAKAKA